MPVLLYYSIIYAFSPVVQVSGCFWVFQSWVDFQSPVCIPGEGEAESLTWADQQLSHK